MSNQMVLTMLMHGDDDIDIGQRPDVYVTTTKDRTTKMITRDMF